MAKVTITQHSRLLTAQQKSSNRNKQEINEREMQRASV